uniref:HEPN AbiU2-like domain-containing protein n=2 Tax=unclassified Tenacibaculum TaxID=2635139 RepID=A0AB33KW74_9FLAO
MLDAISMNKIKNIIIKGLLKEVQIAERSLKLNEKISKSYSNIESQNKKDIAYIIYNLTYTEMVLALSRLYDEPSKKYPTRCLKSLYKITKEQNLSEELSKFRSESELNLYKFGFYPELIKLLKSDSNRKFIKHSTNFFEAEEINPPLVGNIQKLKTIRDKLLAHNEDIEIDTSVPYKMAYELIDHAKKVLSFFSLTYTGITLFIGNKFVTDIHSNKWEKMFEKFIDK